jgi:hypothetical protein
MPVPFPGFQNRAVPTLADIPLVGISAIGRVKREREKLAKPRFEARGTKNSAANWDFGGLGETRVARPTTPKPQTRLIRTGMTGRVISEETATSLEN